MAKPARWTTSAGSLLVLGLLTVLWMLFAVSVSPFASILGTLRIDLLDYDDAFCINDVGHWAQLAPATVGLAAACVAGRALGRWGFANRRFAAWPSVLAYVGCLVAWVLVYTFVGDCGFGEDDG